MCAYGVPGFSGLSIHSKIENIIMCAYDVVNNRIFSDKPLSQGSCLTWIGGLRDPQSIDRGVRNPRPKPGSNGPPIDSFPFSSVAETPYSTKF
jgi:hypothetical protein